MQEKKSDEAKHSRNNRNSKTADLPVIPDKRYFTISEVALLCGVKSHVLRYWEQEFEKLKPVKRRGNRRCYQYEDVLYVRMIRKLLYDDGFTIEGARLKLSGDLSDVSRSIETDAVVKKLISDLESVLCKLKTD